MKVSIIKDWDDPDILRQTPGGRGIWDGISFVTSRPLICDLLVTLNVPPANQLIYCRNGGRWLMSQEPPHEFYAWQTKAYNNFDRVYTFWDQQLLNCSAAIIHDQTCLPWHVGKTYDDLSQLTHTALQKGDEVSWITSNLNNRPGHSLRLSFMDYLETAGFPFHLFGRGFKPIGDKYDGIAPYKYSLALENFACNDYWTEKIADCFLSWTMPIYYGCKNITRYFPEQAMILIDPNKPEAALRIIKEAMNHDRWQQNLQWIEEARNLVLNKYQFFPAIAERVKAAGLGNKKRFYFIRKPYSA
jgi:Glycosyltransferase family 10 (fucosyltransferase) C-term